MKLAVKSSPLGKGNGKDLTTGWNNVSYNAAHVVRHIVAGKPIAVGQMENGYRRVKNFIVSSLFGGDVDGFERLNSAGEMSKFLTEDELNHVLNSEFVRQNAFVVVESASSKPGEYKLRILCQLSQEITDPALYKALVQRIQQHIPYVDTSTSDAARAFFGGKPGRAPLFFAPENVLDVAPFLAAIQAEVEEKKRLQAEREARRAARPRLENSNHSDKSNVVDEAQIEDMLTYIDPKQDVNYAEWLSIIAAVYSAVGYGSALGILEKWTGWCSQPEEIRQKLDSLSPNGPITVGTLIHHAQRCGWQFPPKNVPPPSEGELAITPKARWDEGLTLQERAARLRSWAKKVTARQGLVLEDLRHFPRGVPNRLRSALLGLHLGNFVKDQCPAVITYDVWTDMVRLGLCQDSDQITVEMLNARALHMEWKIDDDIFYKGIQQLTALGFFRRLGKGYTGERGAPYFIYEARPLQEALDLFLPALNRRRWETAHTNSPVMFSPDWLQETEDIQKPMVAALWAQILNAFQDQPRFKRPRREESAKAYDSLKRTLKRLKQTLTRDSLLTEGWFSSPLSLPWFNCFTYRRAYYAELVKWRIENDLPKTNWAAAQEIGVTNKTLKKIRYELGVMAIPQITSAVVKTPSVQAVFEQADELFPFAKDRAFGRWLVVNKDERILLNPRSKKWLAGRLYELVEDAYHTQLSLDLRIEIVTTFKEKYGEPEELEANTEKLQELYARHKKPRRLPTPKMEFPHPEALCTRTITARFVAKQLHLIDRCWGVDVPPMRQLIQLGQLTDDLFCTLPESIQRQICLCSSYKEDVWYIGKSQNNSEQQGNLPPPSPPPEDSPPSLWG